MQRSERTLVHTADRSWPSLVACMAILVSGCFPDHPTPLPSCETPLGTRVSDGRLHVLPSSVTGVSIDSASWHVRTSSPDMNIRTALFYDAHLSATVVTPLDSIAVQFHSEQPAEDSLLFERGSELSITEGGGHWPRGGLDSIRPNERRTATVMLDSAGSRPGAWGCPMSVELIRNRRPPRN